MFSNRYIFLYASAMVIIVALLLSLAATILQPYQQRNLEIEKMKDILGAAGITAEKADIPDTYNKFVIEELVLDESGNLIASYGDGKFAQGNLRAFDIIQKEQLNSLSKTGKGLLPLYIVSKDGKKLYVIPLLGRGLWGPVWGTIALEEDLNTVAGVTFGHKTETPGLGAEIATEDFQKKFQQKKIFNENGEFTSISLVKGGVKNSKTISEIHGVDALSGGTITCDGVTEMLRSNIEYYIPYFKKIKNDGSDKE